MTSDAVTPFGELLRRMRKAAGLTQPELAERAGLSLRGVNDLERGARHVPRRDTVTLLADALGLADEERATFVAAVRRSSSAPAISSNVPSAPASARAGKEPPAGTFATPSFPSGTVTFLFTDIAGSTNLLQQLGGPAYAAARDQHHRLLRTSFAAHGGVEVDTQGDAFFVAFPTAPAAVTAAVEATRALADAAWPDGTTLQVRMGLHTGTPLLAGDHYVGLDVVRAARIAAAGHGGQVLLSQATRDLVEYTLPDGIALRELGAHRLKDLQRPEPIFQMVLPGLPADFPPLKTLDIHRHNLPVQPTPLLGREQAVASVCALLRRRDVRLVTLTGPGGVGKTRLGLQIAAELGDAFADGVWFVRLSRLTDPALVLPTIAQTLGLREAGSQPIAEVLREYLRTRSVLLLLDNFEQVAEAAAHVADLLANCAGLKVLVTSRAVVHLQGEREVPVPPLALPPAAELKRPPPVERLLEVPAVALFVERARAHRPDFHMTDAIAPAVAAICSRLDGLPLALGLAAARVKFLPPPQLLARLERRLPLLTGGARDLEARQQTMRATLAWSEDLLQPEERRLFRRVAVFVGGWTLEAAEAVCTAPEGAEPLGLAVLDGLGALVDQSLVHQRTEGPEGEEGSVPRFGTLQVIREYALEQLEASGEGETLRRAHADYYLAVAEQTEPELTGPRQVACLDWLKQEHDNLRAALGWLRERNEAEVGLRLAGALEVFWFLGGLLSEGWAWLEELFALGSADAHDTVGSLGRTGVVTPTVRARALRVAGNLALWRGDYHPADDQLKASLALAREVGDRRTAALALNDLGVVASFQGKLDRAVELHEESLTLAREVGDAWSINRTLNDLGTAMYYSGDLERAAAQFEEALGQSRRRGVSYGVAFALFYLGRVARRYGDLVRAEALMREALALFRNLPEPNLLTENLEGLAMVAATIGRVERAARLLGAAAALREIFGIPQMPLHGAETVSAVAPARAAVGEDAWAVAFEAGQALTLEEAIAEALGEEVMGGHQAEDE